MTGLKKRKVKPTHTRPKVTSLTSPRIKLAKNSTIEVTKKANPPLAVKSSITGKKGRNTRRRAWRGSPIIGRGFKSILSDKDG